MPYGTISTTKSETFTVTHARHIGIKIGTDLKRMQRFYGEPSDKRITDYENEIIALLRGDYLEKVEYGFLTENNVWQLALKYEARQGGLILRDDDPGGIRIGVDTKGCSFHSFLVTNHRWSELTEDQKDDVYTEAGVSFRRSVGDEPEGLWIENKGYSAGGRGVLRSDLMSINYYG